MSRRRTSRIDAFIAHHEWATRPPDQRYTTLEDLLGAARARRAFTVEYETSPSELRAVASDDHAIHVLDATQTPTALTHWSFGQLADAAAAPAAYLRRLPASLAVDNLNHGLARRSRKTQLYVDRSAHRTLLALTSPTYARVHHDRVVHDVLDITARHPQWHLPLAYKDGEWGAERVPSGAYMSDRDLFLFLVDSDRTLDDPVDPTHPLGRGFIVQSSDVASAKLRVHCFLFRYVCGNHIIWGFQHIVSFERRHVGDPAAIELEFVQSLHNVEKALDADTTDDRTRLLRAARTELGATRDDLIDVVTTRTTITRKQAQAAYDLAETSEPNPRSYWGFAQGLTRLAQSTQWQDQRFALDRAASQLLTRLN